MWSEADTNERHAAGAGGARRWRPKSGVSRRPMMAAALLVAALPLQGTPPSGLSREAMLERLPVRVADNRYAPGVRTAMHGHAAGRFIYVISGGTLRVTNPDGTFADVPLPTGRAGWRAPERHAIENAGRSSIEVLEVELTAAVPELLAADDSTDLGSPDDAPESPGRRVLFRNRWGAIVRYRLESGKPLDPWMPGRDRVLFRLSDIEYSFTREDGLERHASRSAGSWDWYPAGHEPRVTNRSDRAVDLIEIVLEPRTEEAGGTSAPSTDAAEDGTDSTDGGAPPPEGRGDDTGGRNRRPAPAGLPLSRADG